MLPKDNYLQRIEKIELVLQRLIQKKNAFAWVRFCAVLILFTALYFLFPLGWIYCAIAAIIMSAVFIRVVFIDLENKTAIEHQRHLLTINEDELKVLNHQFHHIEDGTTHTPTDHPYANDLDILGKSSLFQYINRTTSEMGSAVLAKWLLYPANIQTIIKRQDAVKELCNDTEWQQALQAYGKSGKIKINTKQKLQDWLKDENSFFSGNYWNWLRYVLPAGIIIVLVLNGSDIIPYQIRNYALLLYALFAYLIAKKVTPIHNQLSKIAEELEVLEESIRLIEKSSFKSDLLIQMRSGFVQEHDTASSSLKQLKKILEKFDLRYNPMIFIPLDIILQWDLQQALDLNTWKKKNKTAVLNWFDILGEFEALNSFSTLYFNNPEWSFPSFKTEHFFIQGTAIGHPLINKNNCILNDININDKGEIMLITGSNMAGKSTYLRSIGTNTVLAMAGAPVFAGNFCLSPVQLISSMRIADNLAESTSTFYAELKKLKTIINSVNSHEKIFILLDEILRGTNSLDRHTGSVALVKQLINKEAACIIATHDVELAKLKNEFPAKIQNYHFDVEVNNEELYFDYKLKTGICTSLNASILMKKIGIEL